MALPDGLTFTVDVEAHGSGGAARCAALTRRLLDQIEAHGLRGTFFVVGEVAEREPALVREIARRGHEVGCHGHRHEALDRLSPAGFRAELAQARAVLENACGAPVPGFRAPMFSLTPRTAWAAEILPELGFAYSSSVLPAWNPLYGWPGAPRRPFLWPSGLLELPCPLGRIGPIAMPFLGGGYLRYLPGYRLRQFSRQQARQGAATSLWAYCHPYDLDLDEPFERRAGTGLLPSLLLWLNRRGMDRRLAMLMEKCGPDPFAARLPALRRAAVPFDPAVALGAVGRRRTQSKNSAPAATVAVER